MYIPKIILFLDNFIWQKKKKKKKKKESILVSYHLPVDHKVRTNGGTKEDKMTALVKQHSKKKKKKKKKKKIH